jgi:transmembrane sensor
VVHDARRPFTVQTPHATIRDVGTTFVVRAYTGDSREHVAVTEGEVAIAGVPIRAHDGATIDATGRVTVNRGIDLSGDLAWIQGGLAFRDTPLRDVVRELARVYDVNVTLADSALGDKPITASFRDEPMQEVLEEVAFVAGAHCERAGRSVIIRRGIAPASEPGHATPSDQRIARQ